MYRHGHWWPREFWFLIYSRKSRGDSHGLTEFLHLLCLLGQDGGQLSYPLQDRLSTTSLHHRCTWSQDIHQTDLYMYSICTSKYMHNYMYMYMYMYMHVSLCTFVYAFIGKILTHDTTCTDMCMCKLSQRCTCMHVLVHVYTWVYTCTCSCIPAVWKVDNPCSVS